MAKERRKLPRLRQFYRCLCAQYPTPLPTVLRLRARPGEPKDFGGCDRVASGRKIAIYVNPRFAASSCHDTLIHEYAHALVWPHARVDGYRPDHSPEWGIRYAEIIEHWTTGDLEKKSWEY